MKVWLARCLAALLLACACLAPLAASGAPEGAPAAAPANAKEPPAEEDEKVAEDSPRASVRNYLDLCRRGAYAEAAKYLDTSAVRDADPAALARRLKDVLDRWVDIDLDAVSALPTGNERDGLTIGRDQLGQIPDGEGKSSPVLLVKKWSGGAARWMFSSRTVARIDEWHSRLESHFLLDTLPQSLRRPGPLGLQLWQWIGLPTSLILAWLLGQLLSRISRAIIGRIAQNTHAGWDDAVVKVLPGPLTLAWASLVFRALLPFLALTGTARTAAPSAAKAAFSVAVFWMLWRAVDLVKGLIGESTWATHSPSSRSFALLAARVGQMVVAMLALFAVLAAFGLPVTSLIAGLGIGGIALALAAQKTVENLFGAVSLGVDQPFRQGDFIKVEGVMGTVEVLGLRSTRIRTLERTIISIPNGKLADMRIETFAPRDRIRFECRLSLAYDSTAESVRKVVADVDALLRTHPKVWSADIQVWFTGIAESSLTVEAATWFSLTDWTEFQKVRQDLLLEMLAIVQRAGTSLATRTVEIVQPRPEAS